MQDNIFVCISIQLWLDISVIPVLICVDCIGVGDGGDGYPDDPIDDMKIQEYGIGLDDDDGHGDGHMDDGNMG